MIVFLIGIAGAMCDKSTVILAGATVPTAPDAISFIFVVSRARNRSLHLFIRGEISRQGAPGGACVYCFAPRDRGGNGCFSKKRHTTMPF